MTTSIKKHCVAFFLAVELKAAVIYPSVNGDLVFESHRLIDQHGGDFMGFYDWLRSPKYPGAIVGVRMWPNDMKSIPETAINNKSYIYELPEKNGLIIWFCNIREFDDEISCDQALGFSRILLTSDKANIAFVVDTDDLNVDELRNLKSVLKFENASWQ